MCGSDESVAVPEIEVAPPSTTEPVTLKVDGPVLTITPLTLAGPLKVAVATEDRLTAEPSVSFSSPDNEAEEEIEETPPIFISESVSIVDLGTLKISGIIGGLDLYIE